MTAPTLGAVLLSTSRPDRLRRWYEAVLDLHRAGGEHVDDLDGRDARFDVGGIELIITGRPAVGESNVEPQRMVLTFVVPDVAAVEARLVAIHAVWLREFETTSWGIIGTVVDPDGNHIQLVQPLGEPTVSG